MIPSLAQDLMRTVRPLEVKQSNNYVKATQPRRKDYAHCAKCGDQKHRDEFNKHRSGTVKKFCRECEK